MSLALVVATHVPEAPGDVPTAPSQGTDVVELRLEGLDREAIPPAIDQVQAPVLATCRREEEGGARSIPEEEREARLEAAVEADADLVDIERDASFAKRLVRQARRANTTVVASEHLLEGTPSPDTILDVLEDLGPRGDVAKLATRVEDPEDVHTLLDAGLKAPRLGHPFALMGVGDATLRALAGPLGQALVYANPSASKVPGQLPTGLQARLPRTPPSPPPQADYLLIGHPVEHSLSPRMQEAAFQELGIDARYRLADVQRGELEAVIAGLRATGAGANVTAPHKQAVHDLADELTPEARRVGAANTLRLDGDQLVAHMTDGLGALDALQDRGEPVQDRRVLLVGAGGTGRAIAHALDRAGADLTLANRTRKKAQALAGETDARVVALEEDPIVEALPGDGLVVNATPIDPPIPDEVLAGVTAFDANYGSRALFARRARAAGARVLDGLDLLVGQGVRSLAFWTGEEPGASIRGVMRTAARTGGIERAYGGPGT